MLSFEKENFRASRKFRRLLEQDDDLNEIPSRLRGFFQIRTHMINIIDIKIKKLSLNLIYPMILKKIGKNYFDTKF